MIAIKGFINRLTIQMVNFRYIANYEERHHQ
jgi:hypothetical protein